MIKKVLLTFLCTILFADFLSAQSQKSVEEGTVIFMYHRFGESKYPSTNIRMEQFEKHLEYLSKNDYKVWPLSKIVRYLLDGRAIPKKTVALTMDDAYISVYTEAFAKLREKNFPFTVFVNSAPIDNRSKNYMSWEQMREMQSFGAEFANHSKTHDYMIPKEGEDEEAWQKRIRYELETAQRRLQEELGDATNENPKLFSYPFGEYSMQTADFIESLGYFSFTQTSGPIGMQSDTKTLTRFPMSESFGDMEGFVLKLNTLPLPIKEISPKEPLTTFKNPPTLTIELEKPLKNLGCYLSSGKTVPLEWLSPTKVKIKAQEKLKSPRDRYTCTAQAKDGRWYWYSHLWIVK